MLHSILGWEIEGLDSTINKTESFVLIQWTQVAKNFRSASGLWVAKKVGKRCIYDRSTSSGPRLAICFGPTSLILVATAMPTFTCFGPTFSQPSWCQCSPTHKYNIVNIFYFYFTLLNNGRQTKFSLCGKRIHLYKICTLSIFHEFLILLLNLNIPSLQLLVGFL